MKSFDDGTARLNRSLFLLIAFGFALTCVEVVHAQGFSDQVREDWGRAAPASVWMLRSWAVAGAIAIALLLIVQFVISFFPDREAVRSLVGSRAWGTRPWQATAWVGIAFAAIALPRVVGSILIADGTVGNALSMQAGGRIDPR